MPAQPGAVVTVSTLAPYRSPAQIPADPAPPPAPPAPPSFDRLFDEPFVVRSRWAWRGRLVMTLAVSAGFMLPFFQGIASGEYYWVVALPFAAFMVPLLLLRVLRSPREIHAEPAGLRFVWGKRTAFYSWRRVKPWSLQQILFGRWVCDINGGPYKVFGVLFFVVPRLHRVGQLLANAHAHRRDPARPA